VAIASAAASAAVCIGSPCASGAITAPARSAIVVSGPVITTRVDVNSAKAIIAPSAAYSPCSGPTPTSSA
jgi:hypothetical protein